MERLTYAPGQQIDLEAGIFFMNTMSGAIEAWTISDPTSRRLYIVSPDNRFLAATRIPEGRPVPVGAPGPECTGHLIDRRGAAAFTWNCGHYRVAALWPRHILFEELIERRLPPYGSQGGVPLQIVTATPSGRLTLLNAGMSPVATFTLPPGGSVWPELSALLSPNERRLALIASRSLYIVELASGSFAAHGEVPDVLGNNRLRSTSLSVGSNGEIVLAAGYPYEAFQGAEPQTLIRRYAWSGSLLSEHVVPGKNAQVSPDGNLIAWQGAVRFDTAPFQGTVNHPIDWPTVVVADAKTGEARFRVRGAALCSGDAAVTYTDSPGIRWLADSSGVVVATKSSYALVSANDGSLSSLWPYENSRWPAPSPDDPNLFAIGRVEVADSPGSTRHRASLATPRFGPLDPWGATSREVRFAMPFPFLHGGGFCGIGVSGAPRVEFQPFDDTLRLIVVGTTSCLPLRTLPSAAAEMLACIRDGSQVVVTETVTKDPVPATASVFYWYTGSTGIQVEVHVRTTEGQGGWVAAQYLDWAD